MPSLTLYLGKVLWKRALGIGDDDDPPEVTQPEDDPADDSNSVQDEMFSSWALFIVLFLLGSALWSSYFLQQRRIKAIHETVLSIFYGMVVGLIIRVSPGHYIQNAVKFNSGYFFNILLPPIILNSGHELHQVNFFRNFGSILTFAIPGTFISAMVLGTILYLWTKIGLDGLQLEFVDALSIGATLSATDPVTILSIFNAYKVDPKLYTIIFGESLLNDAISIVMFETCQKFHGHNLQFSSFFEGVGLFLMTFTISMMIGILVGFFIALILKHSHIRRYPHIETSLVLLFAYEAYFFSNGAHMSGIVSLLFCGITLKHYAHFNMSRRTQIATKYVFQLLAQLSENFIFIYLGLSLFTEVELVFKPLLIIVTFILICIARYLAVFPLSKFLNFVYRARYKEVSILGSLSSLAAFPDEINSSYQMMLFWAGLRGAVGVALAMGLKGDAKWTLLATVLVVVVLTVILFGGTTPSMLEILGIKTGCIDETVDSDDEFDIEMPRQPYSNLDDVTFLGNRRYGYLNSFSGNGKNFNYVNKAPYKDDFNHSSSSIRSVSNGHPVATNSANDSPNEFNEDFSSNELDNLHPIHSSASGGSKSEGVLGSLLNTEDRVQWFSRFDEEVLKPVLLDNLPYNKRNHKDDFGDRAT